MTEFPLIAPESRLIERWSDGTRRVSTISPPHPRRWWERLSKWLRDHV